MDRRRAVISVSERTNLAEFARGLRQHDFDIFATGGTKAFLEEARISCHSISEITGFPEILDGRVKTLHPKLLGGILARGDKPDHIQQLSEQGIPRIDMVVVNLYPFEQTVARKDATFEDAIENIDIGGPTLIRAAAKSYADVIVVTNSSQYDDIMSEMEEHQGDLTSTTRRSLAAAAFRLTARYDALITSYLSEGQDELGEAWLLPARREMVLRYGENPHQDAALYAPMGGTGSSALPWEQLQGKELSYNNIIDMDSAWGAVSEFDGPAVCVIKHCNPCGLGVGSDGLEAYERALSTDPVSAFGGIVGVNRPVDVGLADKLSEIFLEVVVAPDFSNAARQVLHAKKNLRLIRNHGEHPASSLLVHQVLSGVLVQSADLPGMAGRIDKVVTNRGPTDDERRALELAWRVVKWVKSNAIVFTSSTRTLAVGAGQMSRVEAAQLARMKAENQGISLEDSVAASDAFFPFRDGVDLIAEAGATAIIQPGGSRRDDEVIAAANEHDLAMIFTGVRHFRH